MAQTSPHDPARRARLRATLAPIVPLSSPQPACEAELAPSGTVRAAGALDATAGRYGTNPNRTDNNPLVSVANAMGFGPGAGDVSGDPQLCTGPLPGFTA